MDRRIWGGLRAWELGGREDDAAIGGNVELEHGSGAHRGARTAHLAREHGAHGQTERGVSLRINNKQVIPDDLGFFKDTISLHEGLNTIQIIAKKRYSREAIVERIIQVVVKNN